VSFYRRELESNSKSGLKSQSMMQSHGEPVPYRLPLRRLFWLPLSLTFLLVLAVLAGLVAVSWRGLERIRPVQAHLAHIARIQDLGLAIEETLLKGLRGARINPAELAWLHQEVRQIAAAEGALYPHTHERLGHMAQLLERAPADPEKVLSESLAELRQVLVGERGHHELMLSKVAADTEAELRLAVSLLVALPLAGGVFLLWLRLHIKHPLEDMGGLLERLAGRDYRPVDESAVDDSARLVQPLFQSYNALVSRLQELEAEHRAREHTLEREVRQASEALLAQSRELAQAERLAAVGAVSAGLAHKLRNPLAGIQMACTKLHRDLEDKGQAARVAAVMAELKRLNGLLTEKVEATRHEPEHLAPVRLCELVGDLLTLTRYQTPQGVALRADVPEDLECLLPAARLRQALLNLLLNAIQVLGGHGQVSLAAERKDGQLLLRVEDEGPGFPEEMLRAGVRPFATGRTGGTGLGLAMVRRFARDHDGELELANREPRGARVTLCLPCSATGVGTGENQSHG
jgi:two-component system NtrC family sensor kinase